MQQHTAIPHILQKCYDFTRADEVKAAGLYPYFRAIQDSEGPIVQMEGRQVVMAGSNNYLGLTTHPKVREAAIKAIEKYGTSCSGSRYLTGTIDLHEQLEDKLAKFMGKEACLLFSTGFQTGQGVIATLAQRGDYLICDRDNHASIVAGVMLAKSLGAHFERYHHNDMDSLEKVLKKIPQQANKIIISDGVFSTFGGIVNLPELNRLAKQYNAAVLLDDAHSLGVIGKNGRGTASEFGLDDEIDLVMTTFSKTLASLGGFVVGSERVINYLKHHSTALIFSASPTPAAVAAAAAALDVLIENPQMTTQLIANAEYVRQGLRNMGYEVPEGRTAIVPVILGDDTAAFKMWRILYDEGVFVNAFIPPATPQGKSMMRVSFMASHQPEHLNQILAAFKKAGTITGQIPTQSAAVGG